MRLAPAPLPLFALCATAAIAAIAPSCAAHDEPVRASINASFSFPRAVLDKATKLDLRIVQGQVTCDDTTGVTTGDATATEVTKTSLGTTSCPPNIKFCGSVDIEKTEDVRFFIAKASDDSGAELALGCTSAKIDQDAVPITLKMFRFLAPSVCGDNTLQPTEQCDPPDGTLCDQTCQSNEILLSLGAASNNTSTGNAGDKTDPFFLWPPGSGDDGRFLAFYTDHAVPASGGTSDIGLRVMAADLTAATSPPAVAAGSIFSPNGTPFPPTAAPKQQSVPQAAFFGGSYYVVFADDLDQGLDIHLRSFDKSFSADQPVASPVGINGGAAGEANIQTSPAISASTDRLFIAWEDQASGQIVGTTFTPPSTLGNENEISTGTGNSHPQIAVTGKSWITVWTSGTGIKLRAVAADGTPSGSDQPVNTSGAGAASGNIASLPDGRFAVVWSAGSDIFMQRFDAKGLPIAGDQDQPVNDVVKDGDQSEPTIAATSAAGGSYAIAWYDAASGHVRARYVGGTEGFLFNNLNGQSSEFQASRVDGRTRATPVIAVGGSGPFVAIGWEDKGSANAGIIARRFPLPSE